MFIGSFLSSKKGSMSVSEFVAEKLVSEGVNSKLVSKRKNKILRIIDIVISIIFSSTEMTYIEVYSGNAFKITEIAMQVAKFKKKNNYTSTTWRYVSRILDRK